MTEPSDAGSATTVDRPASLSRQAYSAIREGIIRGGQSVENAGQSSLLARKAQIAELDVELTSITELLSLDTTQMMMQEPILVKMEIDFQPLVKT